MSRTSIRLAGPAALACIATAGGALANEMWRPYQTPGDGPQVKAHYVHLVLAIDEERLAKLRRNIQDSYAACKLAKDVARQAGKDPGPLAPPPSMENPELLKRRDVEIYYSAGRSATIVTGFDHYINALDSEADAPGTRKRSRDCSLGEYKSKWLYVRTESGVCEVDLLKRRYRSRNCGWTKTVREQVYGNLPLPPAEVEKIRQQHDAARKRNADPDAWRRDPTARATGERRGFAGQACEAFDIMNGQFEACFATPRSSFAIPASHYAGRHPGLLLQHKWRPAGETLTAHEVRLEIGVSEKLFEQPADVTLDNRLRAERMP